MSAKIDDLLDELQQPARDLIAACDAAGLQPRLTSTLRSHAEQKRLYNRYLAGQAGFPVAPPGQSAHEYGEAFDLVVSPMEALADVGYTWKTWGGGWNPGDAIHFELPGASARAKASRPIDVLVQEYKNLPWWATLPIPPALATETPHTQQIRDRLCSWFGISCGG